MKKTGNRKVHLIAPVLVIMLLLALTVTLSRARIGPLAAAQTPTPAKAGVVCPCGGKLVTALVRELRTSVNWCSNMRRRR